MRKYTDQEIAKACQLRKKGMSLQAVADELGFDSITPIRFHCGERAKFYAHFKNWRKNNKKKWNAICLKAVKKFYAKNSNRNTNI